MARFFGARFPRRLLGSLTSATVAVLVLVGLAAPVLAQSRLGYELWVIDQADAAAGGNKIYIYQDSQLASGQTANPEVLDLVAGARGVGDGVGTRPHILIFNQSHSHGVLANVASGHVTFIRANDRRIVGSVDVGAQAHAAMPTPDDQYVIAANQNGKRLARIRTDFASEQFRHETEADLDLGALEDADHPDNAPICPLVFAPGTNKIYVSMRGGGLYVVDVSTTPMRVVREYGRSRVAPAGCGGLGLGNKMYLNSGTEFTGDLYVLDIRTDEIIKHLPLSRYGGDSHGLAMVGSGRYIWAANRSSGNIVVVDTRTDEIVNVFTIGTGFGGRPDGLGAAPDLIDLVPGTAGSLGCSPASSPMCLAAGGETAFVTMRGPNPATGGHAAIGDRTGFEILRIMDGGLSAERIAFVPIGGPTSDVHGLAVRIIGLPTAAASASDTLFGRIGRLLGR